MAVFDRLPSEPPTFYLYRLTSLTISDSWDLAPSPVLSLLSRSPNLSVLSLSGLSWCEDDLCSALHVTPSLRDLTVGSISASRSLFSSDMGFARVRGTRLASTIAAACPNLVAISAPQTPPQPVFAPAAESDSAPSPTPTPDRGPARRRPPLRVLSLRDSAHLISPDVTTAILSHPLTTSHLTHLTLSDLPGLRDPSDLSRVVLAARGTLQFLEVERMRIGDDVDADGGVGGRRVVDAVRACKALRQLRVYECVGSMDLGALVRSEGGVLEELRCLSFMGLRWLREVTGLGDAKNVAASAMETLHVVRCERLGEETHLE
ncbi:hypothetical protein HK101_002331 [Irineochytrium annulatum]|nr:hypothetical protein HK101_002331 [Irineochytrium annulatum]